MSPRAITRRHLNGLVLVSSSAALAGCTGSLTVSQVATDANLIATQARSVVAAFAGTIGVSPANIAKVQGYLATLQADAAAIATATAGQAVSTAQEIITTVGSIAPILLGAFTATSPYVTIVQALLSLAPVLLQDLGVAAATGKPVATVKFTPAQARAILTAGA